MREHYAKYFEGEIDIYRICRLYNIDDPAIYHAIKKLLRFGDSKKSKKEDIKGAKVALERWIELEEQDNFDKFAEKKRDIEDRLKINHTEETKRDLLYDVLSIMEGYQSFIEDNIGRDIWHINYLCNHCSESEIDTLLEAVRELEDIDSYSTDNDNLEIGKNTSSSQINWIGVTEKKKLLKSITEMSPLHFHPFTYKISKEKDIPNFPDRLGSFGIKDIEDWLEEMDESQHKRVREIIESTKIETQT